MHNEGCLAVSLSTVYSILIDSLNSKQFFFFLIPLGSFIVKQLKLIPLALQGLTEGKHHIRKTRKITSHSDLQCTIRRK